MGKSNKNKLDGSAEGWLAQRQAEDKKAKGRRFARRPLIIAIVSAVLALATVLSLVFLVIIPVIKYDKNFDYIGSDLSKYIELTEEEYKSLSFSLAIAKPKPIDVDIAILGMRAMDKSEKPSYDGVWKSDVAITAGDMVNLYFRGYVIEDGKEKQVMSNMADVYTEIEVGGGDFPAMGFELGLVGVVPNEYTSLEKIKSGTVGEGQVIYLTYERAEEGSTAAAAKGKSVRIDLNDDSIADTYGEEFKDRIINQTIGAELTFNTTINGKTYKYTNTTVDFVTECEDDENVLKLEAYFPYNVGSDEYNNKTVYFDVFVKDVQVYEVPEFDDEYITKKVSEVDSGLRMDELLEYEGESLADKYREYVRTYLDEQYELKKRELITEKLWTHYNSRVKVKKIPGIKVEYIYNEYYSQVKADFEQSGGVIYNSLTGESESHSDDLAGYAKVYLGLWYSEEDWTDVLYDLAEDLVTERLILYYIMKEENLTPTEAELAAKIDEIKTEYMDEYVYQYLLDFDENREDFSLSIDKNKEYVAKMDRIIALWKANDTANEEYAAFYAEREAEMYSYYDEEYFTETAYYEIVMDTLVGWPEITTMDEAAIK